MLTFFVLSKSPMNNLSKWSNFNTLRLTWGHTVSGSVAALPKLKPLALTLGI